MTQGVNKIVKVAQRYKACAKALEIDSIESAISVLLSPQGREFAINTKYPLIEVFRDNKSAAEGLSNVIIDSSAVITDIHDMVVAGNSEITFIASGTKALYHIIAMHGAKVTIKASNYAVVTATKINAEIECINDGTALIKIEE